MNISYEKSKLLKDIETKFKKYPRTNKNRFTRNLLNLFDLLNSLNLFDLLNPRTPLQMEMAFLKVYLLMLIYEKSKLLKDIETKFKKYPRTNKYRFTRNLLNLFDLLNPRTPYKWYQSTTI